MALARQLPILWLTLRQFRAGKAILVVALFAATPAVFSGILLLTGGDQTWRQFVSGMYLDLLAPTVVPLATLILATNCIGNEVADRTMPYLTLKPVSRARIVVEKYTGAVLTCGAIFLIGYLVAWAIAAAGGGLDGSTLIALWIATAVAIAAYGAVFLLISLLMSRALLAGILYILLWESTLARFIPGIRLLSIRHFSESVFVRLLSDSSITLDGAQRLSSALATLAIVIILSLVLSTLRLRSMDLT